MNKFSKAKMQVLLSTSMFLISIFMSISYNIKISNHEADKLTTFAFYVWLFSILAWLVKLIIDIRTIRKLIRRRNEDKILNSN